MSLTHLDSLEVESIYVMQQVVDTAVNPMLLHSIEKDSAVMLHLAIKIFYPNTIPFPLMHVYTIGKFKEMISFRYKINRVFYVYNINNK